MNKRKTDECIEIVNVILKEIVVCMH